MTSTNGLLYRMRQVDTKWIVPARLDGGAAPEFGLNCGMDQ
jgi:hypothetical protein